MSDSRCAAIIPARLQSSRLPNKPLADIGGIPMIVHVFKRCLLAESLDDVYVATDSREIADVVSAHGGQVLMTSDRHETGTDRIAEAATEIPHEVVVNVQGDEALVDPEHVDILLTEFFSRPEYDVAILVNSFDKRHSPSDIKVVLNEMNEVMYLSRSDIPSDARTPEPPLLKAYHIIPFRRNFLFEYAGWEKGRIEQIEFNEYLRILEKGRKMLAVKISSSAISVDTPEDLEFVRSAMKSDPYFPQYGA